MSKILRIKDVALLTGLSKATIYRLVRAKQFPAFFKLSAMASGFSAADVEDWITARRATRVVPDFRAQG